jgi:hypothetical protein
MRRASKTNRPVSFATCLLLASACVARADAIDGEWCQDGSARHFTIKGPDIVTPGGASLKGNYSRHAFTYTAPSTESSGGTEIGMRLMNEFTLHLQEGADPSGPVQIWKRCQPIS